MLTPECAKLWLNTELCGTHIKEGFSGGSAGKESACNSGALGSIPGLGRSPGEGNGYPLRYSGLENSVDCIVYGVAKNQTWLSDFHFTSFHIKEVMQKKKKKDQNSLKLLTLIKLIKAGKFWLMLSNSCGNRKASVKEPSCSCLHSLSVMALKGPPTCLLSVCLVAYQQGFLYQQNRSSCSTLVSRGSSASAPDGIFTLVASSWTGIHLW